MKQITFFTLFHSLLKIQTGPAASRDQHKTSVCFNNTVQYPKRGNNKSSESYYIGGGAIWGYSAVKIASQFTINPHFTYYLCSNTLLVEDRVNTCVEC